MHRGGTLEEAFPSQNFSLLFVLALSINEGRVTLIHFLKLCVEPSKKKKTELKSLGFEKNKLFFSEYSNSLTEMSI